MKRSELKLHEGGLMRCCLESFSMWCAAQPAAQAEPGEEIGCKYENTITMVVDEKGTFVRWIEMPFRAKVGEL